MTVEIVSPDWNEGQIFSRTEGGVTTTKRVWLVLSDGLPEGSRPWHAQNADGIPQEGESHESIPGATVTSLNTRRHRNNANLFEVEVTYSTQTVDGGLSLSDPTEYSYRTISVTEEVIEDINGDQMVTIWTNNSSTIIETTGTAELERPALVIDITRTVSVDPIDFNRAYGGKVNNTAWGPYGPDEVRCEGFTATASSESLGLWRVTGTFFPSPAARGDWLFALYALEGGTIPSGISIGDGISVFNVYERVDLNFSGFVLP